jgi:hypothetical protein
MLSLDYRVPICCLEATQISSGFVAYHGTPGAGAGSPKGSTSTYLTSYWIIVDLFF